MAGWESRIPQVATQTRKRLARAVKDAADEVAARAVIAAPIDTGFLRGSIKAEHPEELTSIVTVGAEYGIFLELGTIRMSARPYLGPAVDLVMARFGGDVRRIFNAK